jgi:hypothetical protein
MMDRRAFITLLGGIVVAAPLAAEGQQVPKLAKIGMLLPTSQVSSPHLVEAFRQGLRELSEPDQLGGVGAVGHGRRYGRGSLPSDIAELRECKCPGRRASAAGAGILD